MKVEQNQTKMKNTEREREQKNKRQQKNGTQNIKVKFFLMSCFDAMRFSCLFFHSLYDDEKISLY